MLSIWSVCMEVAKEKGFSAYYHTIIALMLSTMSFILSRNNKLAYLNQSEMILDVACSVLIGVKIIQSIFTAVFAECGFFGVNLYGGSFIILLAYN